MLARLRIETDGELSRSDFENGLEAYMSESTGSARTRRRNIQVARKIFSDFTFRGGAREQPANLMPRRRVKSKVVIPPG